MLLALLSNGIIRHFDTDYNEKVVTLHWDIVTRMTPFFVLIPDVWSRKM